MPSKSRADELEKTHTDLIDSNNTINTPNRAEKKHNNRACAREHHDFFNKRNSVRSIRKIRALAPLIRKVYGETIFRAVSAKKVRILCRGSGGARVKVAIKSDAISRKPPDRGQFLKIARKKREFGTRGVGILCARNYQARGESMKLVARISPAQQ